VKNAEDRKQILRQVFEDAYGQDLVCNLVSMTPSMLNSKLKELGTTDSTHKKAVSFFLAVTAMLKDLEVKVLLKMQKVLLAQPLHSVLIRRRSN